MKRESIRVALIVTAAGTSSRFATGAKKEFLPLPSVLFPEQNNGTVLSSSVEAFLQCIVQNKAYTLTNLIITISNKNQADDAQKALYASKFVKTTCSNLHIKPSFVTGSSTRQKSVFCALEYLHSKHQKPDIVLIHDAARPFVSTEIVKEVIETAALKGASVPAIPPVDTQKEIDTNGKIIRHLTRSTLAAVQTPQGFHFEKLFTAHKKASIDNKEYTDDTEIWAKYSGDVYIVEGNIQNTKITFKRDLDSYMDKNQTYRTGIGSDLHRLVEGRKLMIGGIEIPSNKGELAHSDGDVLLHAITDSLLGASGIGDIGELFPPNDNKWKNADSKELLQKAWQKVQQYGWNLQNIDCVLHMEKPKFLPWRENVIESIASVLGCDRKCVFVKAKTGEGLGDIGEGRAISAQVVCLLKK